MTLAFGTSRGDAVETETLSALALDAREAHIMREPKRATLKQGKCAVTVPHASGMRVTVR